MSTILLLFAIRTLVTRLLFLNPSEEIFQICPIAEREQGKLLLWKHSNLLWLIFSLFSEQRMIHLGKIQQENCDFVYLNCFVVSKQWRYIYGEINEIASDTERERDRQRQRETERQRQRQRVRLPENISNHWKILALII